ncbi:hypothetical protein N7491_009680 [Penicillium cf. griseofulvum]|nr:hypothetical protein N7491_009680 [Penicillium cf. griseofulvum]
MAKLRLFLSFLLSIHVCQGSLQEVLVSGSPRRKYTLDDINPLVFEKTGVIKCCPVGTEFDGEVCQLANPYCAEEGTKRVGDKCVSIIGPHCRDGTEPHNGVCVERENATCPGDYLVRGNSCVSPQPPSCRAGFEPFGNACVSKIPPKCRGDAQFKDGKCVSLIPPYCPPETELCTGTCVATAICGDGLVLDPEIEQCISTHGPKCPEDTHPENNVCVSDQMPSCPDPLEYDKATKLCAAKEQPGCPDESYTLEGGWCKRREDPTCADGILSIHESSNTARCCPTNYKWDGEFCSILPGTDGKCPDESNLVNGRCRKVEIRKPICDPAYELEGSHCVWRKKPRCPTETHLDPSGSLCVSAEEPKCPRNTKRVGDSCISDQEPICAGGLKPENGKCVSRMKPTCDESKGFFLSGTQCVLKTPPDCKEGQLKGDDCVVGLQIDCPKDTTILGDKCVSQTPPSCPIHSIPDGEGNCLVSVTPTCKVGSPKDGKCVVDSPVCVGDTKPQGPYCVSEESPKCPDPDNYAFINGKCEYKIRPCESGFVPKNGKCVSLQVPDCDGKGTFNGTACVSGEPPCPEGKSISGL